MQLGTRWPVGETPPVELPEVVGYALEAVEADLADSESDTGAWRWTLTWLEGKPVVELDDGTVIRFNDADDSATITMPAQQPEGDDDW